MSKTFVSGDFKSFGFLKEYGQHHKAPVLVTIQQKEILTEIQVQYCFCCCSSCLWQMATSEHPCYDSEVWSGVFYAPFTGTVLINFIFASIETVFQGRM